MSKPSKRLTTVLILAVILIALNLLPFDRWLEPVFNWIEHNDGASAKWLFIGVGVGAVLLFVPVTIPIAAAGALFGFPGGLWPAGIILAAGNALGFLAGRGLWPNLRSRAPFQDPVFSAIRQAIEEEGYPLLVLLRMTPFMHFMTGNLFLGSLNIKFRPYMLASLSGMVPGTLLLVYSGSIAGSVVGSSSGIQIWQWGLLVLGMIVFMGISWRITRKVRRILHYPEKDKSTTTAR